MLGRALTAHKRKGQAAIELAVFGAIVIFVIGMIIRTAVSNVYTQNQNLKAMRYAMLQSLKTSSTGSTSRNTASVLYIEDRLSPDFNKYGALDRNPFIAQGSGTFSNLLFYPVDYDEVQENLPITDMFINGVHLPLTTAAFHDIEHKPPFDPTTGLRFNRFYTQAGLDALPSAVSKSTYRYHGWDFKCVAGTAADAGKFFGCQLYYTIVPNTQANINSGDFCVHEPCNAPLTTLNERFDLNRNDDFSDDPKDNTVTKMARKNMGWQWNAVKGLYDVVSLSQGSASATSNHPSFDVNNDRKEETLYWTMSFGDADADYAYNKYKIIAGVRALDYTYGDLNMAQDDTDAGTVGLLNDSAIYTRQRGGPDATGTYLEIRGTKLLYLGTNTVARSLNKRDVVEVVERRIRLSNNTGRFCKVDSVTCAVTPVNGVCPFDQVQYNVSTYANGCIEGLQNAAGQCSHGDNPVEVCTASNFIGMTPSNPTIHNDCFQQQTATQAATVAKTCLDASTNILYVRSRLMDFQAHKWLTDTSGSKTANLGIGTSGVVRTWGELGIK